ncbi:NAD-dependent epimerase/dehydratase family protein [uncultured Sphingomonas sp.]|uniref:NAD-dependent epimerase/dehydratase family protein n=1 Tax=uncultured Sphingomonas sp. TaxID=158754 RepID=UPI0025D8B272|nr:NAD-dependent epimerase/dehydratase family protein [uncultured Sphingomonas sp.]
MGVAITGADGFVGRAVVRELAARGVDDVLLTDRAFAAPPVYEALARDLADPAVFERVVGADAVLHLAALPGAAAAADPVASRAVNLDLPLSLIEGMAGRRLVLASSIAVFGGRLDAPVDDATVPTPMSVYGTHKRMIELAFADAVRRGAVGGMALRLPGIVARPRGAGGFGSAFLSDLFHAARAREAYTVPVSPEATSWLLSARAIARVLVDALVSDATVGDAITLPALQVRIGALVEALGRTGDTRGFTYAEDARLRAVFGSYPPLATPRAEALGFRADADLDTLIDAAFDE